MKKLTKDILFYMSAILIIAFTVTNLIFGSYNKGCQSYIDVLNKKIEEIQIESKKIKRTNTEEKKEIKLEDKEEGYIRQREERIERERNIWKD